jgi:anti-sigma regulatory factor (Ser/Thr protein kinase)
MVDLERARRNAAVSVELNVDIERNLEAPYRARRVIEDLGSRVADEVRADVLLLVSELVTNGVKYGAGGPLRLQVEAHDPHRVRVEVVDQGDGFIPIARDRPKTEAGGWGLHFVETLADDWGVHEGSTHVWFEIDRRGGAG